MNSSWNKSAVLLSRLASSSSLNATEKWSDCMTAWLRVALGQLIGAVLSKHPSYVCLRGPHSHRVCVCLTVLYKYAQKVFVSPSFWDFSIVQIRHTSIFYAFLWFRKKTHSISQFLIGLSKSYNYGWTIERLNIISSCWKCFRKK